jgi:hypothetical protein
MEKDLSYTYHSFTMIVLRAGDKDRVFDNVFLERLNILSK